MTKTITPIVALLLTLATPLAGGQESGGMPRSEAPADAEAYIVSPAEGAEVGSPFTVRFGLRNMGVAPAGVDQENTGHHHLLIDVDEMPSMSTPLPSTDNIRHFGGGQTQVELDLPPGEHTLQLVLGDHLHIPHDPPVVSEQITITVTE